MRKWMFLAVIAVVAVFSLAVLKDFIIKIAVEVVASQVTGARVSVRSFSLDVLKQSLRITGFTMRNPHGFSRGLLVDIPKVTVDCDVVSLLKGKLHLRLIEIDLREIGLEKNKNGALNVDSLKVVQQPQAKGKKEPKVSKPLSMQIDLLNLSMGRIVSKDYSAGAEPSVRVYDINLKKSYKNITSAQQLAALILAEPMKQAGIKGAAIYGVALLAGVAVLPVAIGATFIGKDSVQQDLDGTISNIFDITSEVLKRIGKVNKEDNAGGVLIAGVNGAHIAVKLKHISDKKTQITISARKYMLPRPEIASGILYQISEKLR